MRPVSPDAFDLLVRDLEAHQNVLSEMHRAALYELVDTLAEYVDGVAFGRRAFALPTGMGKTSAIAAFIATLHKHDHPAAVSVAASKVNALCDLKKKLVDLGVPAQKIGLKHSLLDASEPSTGGTSFQYQLVTHARVRSGVDFSLFGTHEGKPRPLMIYDETLFRSDVLAIEAKATQSALGALRPYADGRATDSSLALAYSYIEGCVATVAAALERLRQAEDDRGVEVESEPRESTEITAYVQAVRNSQVHWSHAETLEDFLRVSQDPLRVVTSGSGGGVIKITEAVPPKLRNVVVLDASQSIRELAQLDDTIELVKNFEASMVKSFEEVKVVQILSGGGRHTIEKAARTIAREKSALSKEIIDLVRENWSTAKGILVFTYKKRSLDISDQLRRDLGAAGFDTNSVGPDGRCRINFLTWGEETSLNGYEFCDVVIMAGVMQLPPLHLVASIRGQKGDIGAITDSALVHVIRESEVAHLVYQGASRGSCRRIDNGRAQPMTLYFVHRDVGIQRRLEDVMPGAAWEQREPKYLKAVTVSGRVLELAARVLAYLRGLPETVQKVSSRQVKRALELADDDATKKAFTRAVEVITEDGEAGWTLTERSLVRTGYEDCFGSSD